MSTFSRRAAFRFCACGGQKLYERNFQPENPAVCAAKATAMMQVPRFGTGRISGQ
jgi:hypothetical protein